MCVVRERKKQSERDVRVTKINIYIKYTAKV